LLKAENFREVNVKGMSDFNKNFKRRVHVAAFNFADEFIIDIRQLTKLLLSQSFDGSQGADTSSEKNAVRVFYVFFNNDVFI